MKMTQQAVSDTIDQEVTEIIAEVLDRGWTTRIYKNVLYKDGDYVNDTEEMNAMFWAYKKEIYTRIQNQGYFIDQINTYWEEVRFAVGYSFP